MSKRRRRNRRAHLGNAFGALPLLAGLPFLVKAGLAAGAAYLVLKPKPVAVVTPRSPVTGAPTGGVVTAADTAAAAVPNSNVSDAVAAKAKAIASMTGGLVVPTTGVLVKAVNTGVVGPILGPIPAVNYDAIMTPGILPKTDAGATTLGPKGTWFNGTFTEM